jgi:hypothetical protein
MSGSKLTAFDLYALCVAGCTLVGGFAGAVYGLTKPRKHPQAGQTVVQQVVNTWAEECEALCEGIVGGVGVGFALGITAPVTLPIALVKCLVA